MGNILSSPPQPGVQGPPGAPGDMGAVGVPGSVGEPGIQGNIGPVGPTGPQGPDGIQGPIGKKGPTGEQGPIGNQGIQGLTGNIGPTGSQGPVGSKGPIGIQGTQGPRGGLGPPGPQGPGIPLSGQNLIFGWTNDNCYSGNSSALSGGSVPLVYSSTGSKIYDKCAQLAVNNNSPIFALKSQPTGSGAQCLWGPSGSSASTLLNNLTNVDGSSIMKPYVNTCTNPCGDGTYCGNTGSYNVFQITQTSPITYMPLNSAYAYPATTNPLGTQTSDNSNIIFNKNNLCVDTTMWAGFTANKSNIDGSYADTTCSNSSTQQFNFYNGQIINMNSGKCLDGGDRWFWNTCNGNTYQTNFSVVNSGNGYMIKRNDTNKCMDLGNPNVNYSCDPSNTNQLFTIPGMTSQNCWGSNFTFTGDSKLSLPVAPANATLLTMCKAIKSLDGSYLFAMQNDGNGVIYNSSYQAVWATGTYSATYKGPYTFALLKSGNIVIYDGSGTITWQTNKTLPSNSTGGVLMIQPDANLVLYNGAPTISGTSIIGNMIWSARLPTVYSGSGIQLWLNAGQGITKNGSNEITQWDDLSGKGRNATPFGTGGKPTLTTGINNLPCVQISKTNGLKCSVPAGTFNNGVTIFVVFKKNGLSGVQNGLISRTLSETNMIPGPFDMYKVTRCGGGNNSTYNCGTSAIDIADQSSPTIFCCVITTDSIWSSTFNGSIDMNSWDFKSGTSMGNASYGDTGNAIIIGTRGDQSTWINGLFGEIILYNGVLNDTDINNVKTYLKNKWNISW